MAQALSACSGTAAPAEATRSRCHNELSKLLEVSTPTLPVLGMRGRVESGSNTTSCSRNELGKVLEGNPPSPPRLDVRVVMGGDSTAMSCCRDDLGTLLEEQSPLWLSGQISSQLSGCYGDTPRPLVSYQSSQTSSASIAHGSQEANASGPNGTVTEAGGGGSACGGGDRVGSGVVYEEGGRKTGKRRADSDLLSSTASSKRAKGTKRAKHARDSSIKLCDR